MVCVCDCLFIVCEFAVVFKCTCVCACLHVCLIGCLYNLYMYVFMYGYVSVIVLFFCIIVQFFACVHLFCVFVYGIYIHVCLL